MVSELRVEARHLQRREMACAVCPAAILHFCSRNSRMRDPGTRALNAADFWMGDHPRPLFASFVLIRCPN